jgi:hypothetical protein
MAKTSIVADIHSLIDTKLASNVIVTVAWVTRCVMEGRPDISGDDADFYRECAARDIAGIVRSALGKYDAKDDTPRDLLLPGFEHLCRAYSFTRGGEVVVVPVALCTDAELAERAGQLDEMAKGCRAHAREIREFMLARPQVVAA